MYVFVSINPSLTSPSPRTDPSNIEGNAESARVVGLLPWMDYEFQVIASNILGSGEPSMSSHTVRTQQAAPTVAPSGLGGGGGDRNELIITWTVSVSVCVCVRVPECVCVHFKERVRWRALSKLT